MISRRATSPNAKCDSCGDEDTSRIVTLTFCPGMWAPLIVNVCENCVRTELIPEVREVLG